MENKKNIFKRVPLYIGWIFVLAIFSFIQLRLIGFLADGFITDELSSRNPGVDGPQLFPAFILINMLLWAIIIPIGNYLFVIFISHFWKKVALTRNERLGILVGWPITVILTLLYQASILSLLAVMRHPSFNLESVGFALVWPIRTGFPFILYFIVIGFMGELTIVLLKKVRDIISSKK